MGKKMKTKEEHYLEYTGKIKHRINIYKPVKLFMINCQIVADTSINFPLITKKNIDRISATSNGVFEK